MGDSEAIGADGPPTPAGRDHCVPPASCSVPFGTIAPGVYRTGDAFLAVDGLTAGDSGSPGVAPYAGRGQAAGQEAGQAAGTVWPPQEEAAGPAAPAPCRCPAGAAGARGIRAGANPGILPGSRECDGQRLQPVGGHVSGDSGAGDPESSGALYAGGDRHVSAAQTNRAVRLCLIAALGLFVPRKTVR